MGPTGTIHREEEEEEEEELMLMSRRSATLSPECWSGRGSTEPTARAFAMMTVLSRLHHGPPREAERSAGQMKFLAQRLRQQERELRELRELVSAAVRPLPDDPIERWRRDNLKELSKFVGQRVAIHPTKGIVAHDESTWVVVKRVRELGLSDEVVIESVHPARATAG